MNCSVCFLVILLGAFGLSSAEDSLSSGKMELLENFDLDDFLRENPGVNLTKMDVMMDQNQVIYTFGHRELYDYSLYTRGVTIQATERGSMSFRLPYAVPREKGAVITFVWVAVERTSYESRAFVYKGGIGQRHIGITVEAWNTYLLSFNAHIYGK